MYYRDVTHGDNCKQIKLKMISEPHVPKGIRDQSNQQF